MAPGFAPPSSSSLYNLSPAPTPVPFIQTLTLDPPSRWRSRSCLLGWRRRRSSEREVSGGGGPGSGCRPRTGRFRACSTSRGRFSWAPGPFRLPRMSGRCGRTSVRISGFDFVLGVANQEPDFELVGWWWLERMVIAIFANMLIVLLFVLMLGFLFLIFIFNEAALIIIVLKLN